MPENKKSVKTEGSYKDMAQYAGVDEKTIEGAVNVVEQAADIDVEVPEEK